MRWESLFGDLEAQWEAEVRRDLDSEVADRTRRERATIGLYERLAAAIGSPVRLGLVSGGAVSGEVFDVGDGWVLVGGDGQRPALVPFGALVMVGGLGERAAGSATGKRFGFGYALRGLSRDRAVVALTDVAGGVTTGTIDAVGSDALDLSEHAADAARRPENVTGRRVVPFAAIASLRPG